MHHIQRIQEILSSFSVISTPGYLLPPPLPDPVYCFWFSPSVAPVLSLICISLLFLLLIPVKIWFCILPSYYRINTFFCCIGLLSLRLSSFSTPSHTSRKPCISLLFCFWSAAWSPILLVFPVKYSLWYCGIVYGSIPACRPSWTHSPLVLLWSLPKPVDASQTHSSSLSVRHVLRLWWLSPALVLVFWLSWSVDDFTCKMPCCCCIPA